MLACARCYDGDVRIVIRKALVPIGAYALFLADCAGKPVDGPRPRLKNPTTESIFTYFRCCAFAASLGREAKGPTTVVGAHP